ncbi:MAG: ATP-binding protein, partial [Kofleriaceae bacterium]
MDALVGRDRELAQLVEAARIASAGQRAIVMISGEPGIGKTRLLEEIAATIEQEGGTAAWGRTWEVGMTPAFWPWTQLLALLATPDDPAPELVGLDDRADAATRL